MGDLTLSEKWMGWGEEKVKEWEERMEGQLWLVCKLNNNIKVKGARSLENKVIQF